MHYMHFPVCDKKQSVSALDKCLRKVFKHCFLSPISGSSTLQLVVKVVVFFFYIYTCLTFSHFCKEEGTFKGKVTLFN